MEEDMTARLITLVQGHSNLYDLRCKEYRNAQKTYDTWKFVGEKLGMSGADAKKKWKSLRASYGRVMKKKKEARSGSAASHSQEWPYLQAMQFLAKFKTGNSTCTNYTSQQIAPPSTPLLDITTDNDGDIGLTDADSIDLLDTQTDEATIEDGETMSQALLPNTTAPENQTEESQTIPPEPLDPHDSLLEEMLEEQGLQTPLVPKGKKKAAAADSISMVAHSMASLIKKQEEVLLAQMQGQGSREKEQKNLDGTDIMFQHLRQAYAECENAGLKKIVKRQILKIICDLNE